MKNEPGVSRREAIAAGGIGLLAAGSVASVAQSDGAPGAGKETMVRVEDAKWGTFLGCVPADHIDQVGHLFGDKPGLINPFNHKKMFRWLVKMLRLKGH